MLMTTLCYIERDGRVLMLHRTKKKHDINQGKWIGVGGKFEARESPEECLVREVREETGLTLTRWRFRGFLTFLQDDYPTEFICLYTADGFEGALQPCDEGELAWIRKEDIPGLSLWPGDRVFLRLLAQDRPFFSMKLLYHGDDLAECLVDGQPLEE